MPSLLANISNGVRNSAIKSADKLSQLVKGDGADVDVDTKLVNKYEFKTGDRHRELSLAHAENTWYIKVDSELVVTKAHNNSSFKTFETSTDFSIPAATGEHPHKEPLTGVMTMKWVPRSAKWQYTLLVNDVALSPSWSKTKGSVEDFEAPEVGEKRIA